MPSMPSLIPRYDDYNGDDCYQSYGQTYCNRRTPWNDWVRWLVLAIILIGFFLLFALCSCITARRRRRAGRHPYYGTGWMAHPGAGGPNNQQNAQPYYNNGTSQPAPPYSANPPPNAYYGADQGYYGQQQGVEMQPPAPSYNRGGAEIYTPPPGPPPPKQ